MLPLLPSIFDALVAAIDSEASSLTIVPVADDVPNPTPTAFDNEIQKPSSGSNDVSPLTLIVSVCVVSPAAKLSVPLGKLPPKSAASAAFKPWPVTAKSTL